MNTFEFANNAKDSSMLEEVFSLVMVAGNKTWSEAYSMLHQFWAGSTDLSGEGLHSESPYYWAMCILHHPTIGDNQPEWYLDARFMPPPEPYRSKYYSR